MKWGRIQNISAFQRLLFSGQEHYLKYGQFCLCWFKCPWLKMGCEHYLMQQESNLVPLVCNSTTKVIVPVKHVRVYYQILIHIKSFLKARTLMSPADGWSN